MPRGHGPTIRAAWDTLAASYIACGTPPIPFTDHEQAARHLEMSASYLQAAAMIVKKDPDLIAVYMPWSQLMGHALELAFKACACSVSRLKKGHDLIILCEHAESLGFVVDPAQYQSIARLNHLYSSDAATGNKYHARYWSQDIIFITPDRQGLIAVIEDLHRQSQGKMAP